MIGKNQCQHGSLARSCEICELESENTTLKAELDQEKHGYRGASSDRDRWKEKAERLAKVVELHITGKTSGTELVDALAVFEQSKATGK